MVRADVETERSPVAEDHGVDPVTAAGSTATAGSTTAVTVRRSTGSRGSTHRHNLAPDLTASYARTPAIGVPAPGVRDLLQGLPPVGSARKR